MSDDGSNVSSETAVQEYHALDKMWVYAGVLEGGAPFCQVKAVAADGTLLLGQMSPDSVRDLARDWMATAEAAEMEAAIFRRLQTDRVDLASIAAFIEALRRERGAILAEDDEPEGEVHGGPTGAQS